MTTDARPGQMSLRVGDQPPDMPIYGSLKVKGSIAVADELYKRDRVTISIADADGQILVTTTARVTGIGHIDHDATRAGPEWTERVHTLTPED